MPRPDRDREPASDAAAARSRPRRPSPRCFPNPPAAPRPPMCPHAECRPCRCHDRPTRSAVVLLHLAQGASADPGGWTVTTSIAAAAAVISLTNLVVTTYFTGRREHMKWAREALAEAFYKYVD